MGWDITIGHGGEVRNNKSTKKIPLLFFVGVGLECLSKITLS